MTELYKLPWLELDAYVKQLMAKNQRPIWQRISNDPLNKRTIERLCEAGLIIHSLDIKYDGSFIPTSVGLILLNYNLSGYERDKVLFHELAHAHYGNEINDCMTSQYKEDNNAIAEWIGRRARADPVVLRHAILSFELELQIYDKVSYEAFTKSRVDLTGQLNFGFAADYFRDISTTLLD